MLVLGLETSTGRSSVALVGEDGLVASASLGVARRHGEFLAPAVRFCLDQAGVGVDRLTGVAVGLGPGLYTGLRVGIATAQAIAAARQLPVVGLSGLDVLGFQQRHVRRPVFAVLDARRGELFWASYRAVPGGVQRQDELRVGTAEQLAADIQATGQECLVTGDGLTRAADELRRVGVEVDDTAEASPDAAALAELALPRFAREETQRPGELLPIYLRQVDAKIGWQTRGRLQGGAGA
ncbi:tRNA (adenosine(37)-N6)-threonylcarbamoyltransferase complex dimerization subunit type 1 TsaB [Egicoccus halophilus]|uniref:tRNA (Adenosine(37)-N6)-threonylcarbamoyltransferase complex dimerization subunit type 1 TsaB n=1 Tax=Egicoccus halophilus TaxID=1670830 RepID=A0A8J3A7U1_9ACTN|nr:tRNA (adenosine(37)-N6)-threonylcarbamoyltransferase complex dimerization subunit type 1 TsaB [Egicoccus halophilus]GGI05907.1 tRNA (adenosine(37)-N6)-threonylcarbamoyltransferase complex dimerization subunit type 1 TsaB [Egicoccus halophilus]